MVVFGDLLSDLSVGDFSGTLVEQPGACHADSVLKTCFDEFANDVVVGDGSGSLEDELEVGF